MGGVTAYARCTQCGMTRIEFFSREVGTSVECFVCGCKSNKTGHGIIFYTEPNEPYQQQIKFKNTDNDDTIPNGCTRVFETIVKDNKVIKARLNPIITPNGAHHRSNTLLHRTKDGKWVLIPTDCDHQVQRNDKTAINRRLENKHNKNTMIPVECIGDESLLKEYIDPYESQYDDLTNASFPPHEIRIYANTINLTLLYFTENPIKLITYIVSRDDVLAFLNEVKRTKAFTKETLEKINIPKEKPFEYPLIIDQPITDRSDERRISEKDLSKNRALDIYEQKSHYSTWNENTVDELIKYYTHENTFDSIFPQTPNLSPDAY